MKHFFNLTLAAIILLVATGCTQPNEAPNAKILEPANNTRLNELTVTFKAESSDPENELKSTTWYFGDGNQEEGGNEITHTYREAGKYTVSYTVLDDQDQDDTSSINITINAAPSAAARASAEVDGRELSNLKAIKGNVPMEVKFQGSASRDEDGEIASYQWDFGNGTSSDEADPIVTFEKVGNLEVVLTITDNEGASSQDRITLELGAKPVDITDVIEDATPEKISLIRGTTLAGSETNKTVLYSYHINDEGPFTEKEVNDTLIQAMLNLAQEPQISHATIYLFTELKQGFTDPGDYNHFLGMAQWERPFSDADLGIHIANNTTMNLNNKYFDGTASNVVPYSLHQTELDVDDPRCTICPENSLFYTTLVLNPIQTPAAGEELSDNEYSPLCKEEATATIQAVVQRGLLLPGAYGLNIYETSNSFETGVAIGLWGARTDLTNVDSGGGLLYELADGSDWEIDGDDFKLKFTKDLPSC